MSGLNMDDMGFSKDPVKEAQELAEEKRKLFKDSRPGIRLHKLSSLDPHPNTPESAHDE